MEDDRDGETVYVDPDGRWFTVYDDSEGHCPLCGRLTCRGGCFK